MRWRTKNRRLWSLIGTQAALLLLPAVSTLARTCPARNWHAVVRVRVYDYARIEPSLLRQAEHISARVFAKEGVETMWINVPALRVSAADARRSTSWYGVPVDVRILPNAKLKIVGSRVDAIGLTSFADGGAVADLFYDRIWDLAGDGIEWQKLPVFLGYALSHEIGHVLLGPGHSITGVMLGKWGRNALEQAFTSRLVFADQDARRLRSSLLLRSRARWRSWARGRSFCVQSTRGKKNSGSSAAVCVSWNP